MNWGQATMPPAAAGAGGGGAGRGAANVPLVAKYKWLEPRHMTNISDRWQRDKNVDLQYAFFNGIGMETWENIWGIWNEMTPRDSEVCRRVAKIDRQFSGLLISMEWEPHTPAPLQSGIYASKFPGQEQTLWTIVNKNEFDVSGKQMRVPHKAGRKYYDLWHGVELTPEVRGETATLSFEIEGDGYGALLASDAASPPADLQKFLGEMSALGRTRLNSFTRERRFLPQQMVEIPPTRPAANPPAGMVRIPAGEFEFQVAGIEIEGSNEIGVDVQYPWENSPRRNHRATLTMKSFYIDRYAVIERGVQEVHGHGEVPTQGRPQLLEGLEERRLPGRLGEQAGDVGVARRRASVCGLGGQAAAARMGVAICGPGRRRASLSVGKRLESSGGAGSGERSRSARAGQWGRSPGGSQSVWGDGPDRQRLAVDR